MPAYIFTAKNLKGEIKEGVEEASSQKELALRLRSQGFLLVKVEEVGAAKTKQWKQLDINKIISRFRRVSLLEKMLFARHLAVMVGAGLSLTRSISALEKQSVNLKFKEILNDLINSINQGQSFSYALSRYSNVFNELFINIIKVAEVSGNMEESLNLLAEQMRKDYELRSRVRGAMIYPAVIVFAMIGIGIFMMIFVVPQLTMTFQDLGVDLPLTTRIIIAVSSGLAENPVRILGGFLAIVFLLYKIARAPWGKEKLHWLFLRLPIFGSITKKVNIARLVRTLGSLIQAGVPIVRAVLITSNTVGNKFYQDSLRESAKKVEKGLTLSSALKDYPLLYLILIVQMVEVGEETGTLSDILKKLADFFEEEVSNTTKSLASIIEPVLMIIIGSAVGFFAVSMLQPMYGLIGEL